VWSTWLHRRRIAAWMTCDGDACGRLAGLRSLPNSGRGVERLAVAVAVLMRISAVGCGYGDVGAFEDGALLTANADARVLVSRKRRRSRVAAWLQWRGWSGGCHGGPFFMVTGVDMTSSAPLLEGEFVDVGEDLRLRSSIAVSRTMTVACFRFRGRFVGSSLVADGEAEDVGKALRVAGAGAIADGLDAHWWLRAEGGF